MGSQHAASPGNCYRSTGNQPAETQDSYVGTYVCCMSPHCYDNEVKTAVQHNFLKLRVPFPLCVSVHTETKLVEHQLGC